MEIVSIYFADGEVLELGQFGTNKWDAIVGESGSLIVATPKGTSIYAPGQWLRVEATKI